MTYPPPTYLKDSGEVSARLRPDDAGSDLAIEPFVNVEYLATAASTEGGFGLYRWTFSVGGAEPHFHRTISESFYVLDGTVSVYDGRSWRDASAGDFLYVPAGGIHGFRNESGQSARMLLLFAPGAPREEYFETLFAGGTKNMTEEEKDAFYLRHDNHLL